MIFKQYTSTNDTSSGLVANESYSSVEDAYRIIAEACVAEASIFESVLGSDFAEAAFNNGTITEAQMISIQEASIKEAGEKALAFIKEISQKIMGVIKGLVTKIRMVFISDGKELVKRYGKTIEKNISDAVYNGFSYNMSEYKPVSIDGFFVTKFKEKVAKLKIDVVTEDDKDVFREDLAKGVVPNSSYDSFVDDFVGASFGEETEQHGMTSETFSKIKAALSEHTKELSELDKLEKNFKASLAIAELEIKASIKLSREDKDAKAYDITNITAISSILSTFASKIIIAKTAVLKKSYAENKKVFAQLAAMNPAKAKAKVDTTEELDPTAVGESADFESFVEFVSSTSVDELFA